MCSPSPHLLLFKVIHKICIDKANIILIAPTWPTWTWFPHGSAMMNEPVRNRLKTYYWLIEGQLPAILTFRNGRVLDICQNKQISAVPTPLAFILELGLKKSGLFISSIKVHLAAIPAFHHKINGTSIFACPITKRFLMGIRNIYPEVHALTPPGDLNLVLCCLIGPLIEPLATCFMTHLWI